MDPVTSKPRFRGALVMLSGVEYTIPALSIGSVRDLMPKINALGISTDGTVANPLSQLGDILEICFAAFRRNYPEIDWQTFIESVELQEFEPLINAVLSQSGLRAVPEKNAEAAASHSTGMSSTPDSPPPSDGVGSTSTNT